MIITRRELEKLIIETYSQFATTLNGLYAIIPKKGHTHLNREQSEIVEIYKEYCTVFGVISLDGDPRKKMHEELMPEIQKAPKDTIADMAIECIMLANRYKLPVYNVMPKHFPKGYQIVDEAVSDAILENATLEKLIAQVGKFGDEELGKRLAEVESGQSRIVFEKMKKGTEGQTVFDDGKITYKLNKKYEKTSDEAELLRASIILAHEL
jgi:hypothetical protein